MSTSRNILVLLTVVIIASLAFGGGDEYDLSWHTIDGGGGTSTGGGFTLSGTIGQPDAGVMSGGGYALTGGFWAGAGPSGGDPTPTCPADIAPPGGDGVVGVADLLALLAAWGPNPGHPADLTGDGVVGVADLLALLAAWGPCP